MDTRNEADTWPLWCLNFESTMVSASEDGRQSVFHRGSVKHPTDCKKRDTAATTVWRTGQKLQAAWWSPLSWSMHALDRVHVVYFGCMECFVPIRHRKRAGDMPSSDHRTSGEMERCLGLLPWSHVNNHFSGGTGHPHWSDKEPTQQAVNNFNIGPAHPNIGCVLTTQRATAIRMRSPESMILMVRICNFAVPSHGT